MPFSDREMASSDENKDDKSAETQSVTKRCYRLEIVWRNVFIMSSLHLIAVYGFYRALLHHGHLLDIIFLAIFQHFCALGILAGAHRLWSHKSYKAHLPLRIFLAVFQTASIQNDIYEWCRDHRLHHKYSETDADPHNSKRGYFFAHMGWLLCKKHPDVKEKGKTLDMSDLWADPLIRFQRRFYIPLVLLIRFSLFSLIAMKCFHYELIDSLCVNITLYVLQLHRTWLVNSSAHVYGMRPYDQSIEPRENQSVVYLALGEGYHNYHHTFPYDYSASEHGWATNYNPATFFIDMCAQIGLAYDRRKPPESLIESRRDRTGAKHSNNSPVNVLTDYIQGEIFVQLPFIVISMARIIL